MPTNKFSSNSVSVLAPYTRAVTITPSDTVDLTETTRAINVYAAASPTTVKVIFQDDTVAVTLYLQTGKTYPLRVTRIYSTGTTATAIVALY
jgi:hypothetical protein